MKTIRLLLLAITGAFLTAPLSSAVADPWKDESGHSVSVSPGGRFLG